MKIFDWVHRRFIPKDGLGQHVKKDDQEILNSDADTIGLLDESMVEYHGLNGSILSIGTFGLLKDDLSNNNHDEELLDGFMDKNIDDDQNKLELELELDDDHHHDHDQDNQEGYDDEEEEEAEGEWNPLLLFENRSGRGAKQMLSQMNPPPTVEDDDDRDPLSYYHNLHKQEKRTERRITLADLFSAESDGDEDDDGTTNERREIETCYCSNKVPPRPNSTSNKKLTTTAANAGGPAAKNGILFAKKLIPRVKEDSRPIQKLHRLMKRMLKRKIHPDINLEAKKNFKPCPANGILPSNCMA